MAVIIKNTSKKNTAQFWSMLCVWGIVIYVAVDIVLAFLRPDYSSLHNAESDYGRGPYFWLMDINFLLRCLLSLALANAVLIKFAKIKAIKQASFWLILWAFSSGLLAFFADNPYGYPKLRSGDVHLILAFIAFIAALVTMILFSRLTVAMHISRSARYCLIGLTYLAIVALVLMGHAGILPHSYGGLYERIFLGSVLIFEAILALSIRKDKNRQLDKQVI